MPLAVRTVFVHGGSKGVIHLTDRSTEYDRALARGLALEPKPLRLQPRPDEREVRRRHAEAIAEFLGCQPVVILGTAAGLEIAQKIRESRVLRGTGSQYHDYALRWECRISCAQIHAAADGMMELAFELGALRVVDPLRDSRYRSRRGWACG
jgi:hypothetical protein